MLKLKASLTKTCRRILHQITDKLLDSNR